MLLGLMGFLHGLMGLLRTRKSNEMYFKFALSSFKNHQILHRKCVLGRGFDGFLEFVMVLTWNDNYCLLFVAVS